MEHSGLFDYRIMEHCHAGRAAEGTPLFLVTWEHRKGTRLALNAYAPCHLAHTLRANPSWTFGVREFLNELSIHLQGVDVSSRAYFLALGSRRSNALRALVCGSCSGADLECVVENFFSVCWPRGFESLAVRKAGAARSSYSGPNELRSGGGDASDLAAPPVFLSAEEVTKAAYSPPLEGLAD